MRRITASIVCLIIPVFSISSYIDVQHQDPYSKSHVSKSLDSFFIHVEDVYLKGRRIRDLEHQIQAKLLGFALGRQAVYVQGMERRHALFEQLKKDIEEYLFDITAGSMIHAHPAPVDVQEGNKLWRKAQGAMMGFNDKEMIAMTRIDPNRIPNMFTPQGGGRRVIPRDPDSTDIDAVAGVYDCRTEGWPIGSLEIWGTMERFSWEFKLSERGRLRWHWKGKLTWNGRSRTLAGKGHNQQHQQTEPVTMRLVKGDDGKWRAGNFFLGNRWILTKRR